MAFLDRKFVKICFCQKHALKHKKRDNAVIISYVFPLLLFGILYVGVAFTKICKFESLQRNYDIGNIGNNEKRKFAKII